MPRDDLKDPAALVRAIAERGDRAAFARLFGFYAPRIKGFLMRSGSAPEIAEELAQEALLAVWRKAATFDAGRAGVSTWIFTIARNLRIDHVRRGQYVSVETIYEVLGASDPQRPDDEIDAADRDERVRNALASLSSEQAAVVRLSFYENKAHAEIARLLQVPLGTVKSRLRLAMTKLRGQLGDAT